MNTRLLSLGLALFHTGCLPKKITKLTDACSVNGECEDLAAAVYGRMPPMPTRQDETDKSTKDRVVFLKNEANQLVLHSERQAQCRNIYTINDVYVLPPTRFPRGAPWLFGGAMAATGGLALQTRSQAVAGYTAIGTGALAMGYGIYANRLTQKTRISHQHDVKGEYGPCGDWSALPNQPISILLPAPKDAEESMVAVRIETDAAGEYLIPKALSGAIRINHKDRAQVLLENGVQQEAEIPPLLLDDTDWICDVLQSFDSLALPDESPENWTVNFRIADAVFAVPWLQHGGQDFFSHHQQAIQSCDKSTRKRFARLAAQFASGSSSSTTIRNIIQNTTRSPVPKSTTRTSRRRSGSNPSSTSESNPSTVSSTTIVLGRAQKIAGSYRCTSGSRKANLNIRQDGNFVLMVELDTGTAYGICSDQTCGIQGISGTAMAFTSGLKRFSISKEGDELLINGGVNCVPRRRR